MPLTDIACKNATCPPERLRARFTDGGGLYLEVSPNGSKRWFWKYTSAGKEKRLALGSYPDVSVKQARADRDDARKVHRTGIDPVQKKQVDKLQRKHQSTVTFEAVAREYHQLQSSGWSDTYIERWIERMEKDAFPWIGSLPLDTITAPLLLQVLRRVETRGALDTGNKALAALARGMLDVRKRAGKAKR
jgi:hypothetical protein